jgi:Mn-dependent DtxR family transcriptional regulator
MPIYESGEDYLETILILCEKKSAVRAIDIANELDYTKPSISRAMKKLKENGYITVNNDGHISLTEQGKSKAESVYERHQILRLFLIGILGVSETTAEQDACKIEHILSEETYAKLKDFCGKCKSCVN